MTSALGAPLDAVSTGRRYLGRLDAVRGSDYKEHALIHKDPVAGIVDSNKIVLKTFQETLSTGYLSNTSAAKVGWRGCGAATVRVICFSRFLYFLLHY